MFEGEALAGKGDESGFHETGHAVPRAAHHDWNGGQGPPVDSETLRPHEGETDHGGPAERDHRKSAANQGKPLITKENEVRIDRFLLENMKYLKELVFQDDDQKRMKILDHYRQKFKKNKAKTLKQQTEEQENEDEDEEEKEDSDEDDFMSDDDEEKFDPSPVENDQKTKDIVDKIVELENEQENYRKNKQDLERQKKQIVTKASSFSSFLKRTE